MWGAVRRPFTSGGHEEPAMDKIMLWGRAFPIVAILVCIVAIVLIKKVFAREGASSGMNTAVFILFALIVGCVGLAVWGFKNVHPPDISGQYK
jgi:hypothetical protein